MITPQEVRAFPIFAQLGDAELERLAKRSADVHLQRGDYATHEGERAALFVMLEGEADVTRSIDGIAWLPESIARDERGYVLTGDDARKSEGWNLERDPYLLETSVPGIFASFSRPASTR